MISNILTAIVTALKDAGYNAEDKPASEWAKSARNKSSYVGVMESDCDYSTNDANDILTARYTVKIDVYVQGTNATTTARANMEAILGVLINADIGAELVLTGWTREDEPSIMDAQYTISCDIFETLQIGA